MKIDFDLIKSDKNLAERGLPFDRASDFGWGAAEITIDVRNDYAEIRYVAVGYLDHRLHILCFTPVANAVRVISFTQSKQKGR